MAPAGNNKHCQRSMDDTFLLSNVVPQVSRIALSLGPHSLIISVSDDFVNYIFTCLFAWTYKGSATSVLC
jgi:DNA/RNA endonuclease G (NUC1)